MNQFFSTLIQFDGYAFLVIGLIVLAFPSPQPGLAKPVAIEDLAPFSQTRRLLAAMFVASALLLIVIGRNIDNREILQEVGIARIVSFLLVIVLNIIQLRSNRWKAAPLLALILIFSLFTAAYTISIINY